ncbi:MAG: tRNA-dihydrouridine synthase, partial [Chthoniobacteraceae bacterium]
AAPFPVTAKIRTGWSAAQVNATTTARVLEGAGVQALAVHGRTKEQGYSGYSDISCYGAKQAKTPNLDRLAAQGCRFTDAHSPTPNCTPTRRAFLTEVLCIGASVARERWASPASKRFPTRSNSAFSLRLICFAP